MSLSMPTPTTPSPPHTPQKELPLFVPARPFWSRGDIACQLPATPPRLNNARTRSCSGCTTNLCFSFIYTRRVQKISFSAPLLLLLLYMHIVLHSVQANIFTVSDSLVAIFSSLFGKENSSWYQWRWSQSHLYSLRYEYTVSISISDRLIAEKSRHAYVLYISVRHACPAAQRCSDQSSRIPEALRLCLSELF